MAEIITINGVKYSSNNVTTDVDSISFDIEEMSIDEAKSIFKDVTSLTVGDNNSIYGEYPYIKFHSVTEYGEDGRLTITMHILSDIERQIKDLQESQAEQDEVLAEMLYGGGNNE